MFDNLKSKLADVFNGLARRGALSESDVDAALREVRLALLDADVALPAVKVFTEKVREKAVGVASMRAVRWAMSARSACESRRGPVRPAAEKSSRSRAMRESNRPASAISPKYSRRVCSAMAPPLARPGNGR